MKRTFLPLVTFLVLGLGLATYAQQPGPGRRTPSQPDQTAPGAAPGRTPDAQQPDSPDGGQGQRVSVTGCLAKGTQANQYVITDSSSHEKYSFPGPTQLDRYVNQTVKLTGSMEAGDKGEKVFRPESIAPVSSSCS
jgi:hypothetical protein